MAQRLEVLVVGGGPGGLLLAQGLKKHGIPVTVFERDRARADYLQGFRLRIRERAIEALRANLPPALFRAFEETTGRAPAANVLVDEHLAALPGVDRGPADDTHYEKSVSRITLRQILLSGLEDVLRLETTYTRYEELPDGRLRAHFADGGTAEGDVLVGADGASSGVRRQLLPDAPLVDTGARRLAGKIELNAATRAALDPLFLTKTVSVKSADGYSLFFTAHEQTDDRDQPSGIGGNDAAADILPGLLFDNTKSYLMWAFSGRRGALPPDEALAAMDGEAMLAFVETVATAWHPSIRAALRLTDPSSVGALPIRTSLPVEAWPTRAATLLGDALHSMTYFRALGANSALHDANLLRQALVSVRDHGTPLLSALSGYEAAMRASGFEAVRASLAAFEAAHGKVAEAPADPVR